MANFAPVDEVATDCCMGSHRARASTSVKAPSDLLGREANSTFDALAKHRRRLHIGRFELMIFGIRDFEIEMSRNG